MGNKYTPNSDKQIL